MESKREKYTSSLIVLLLAIAFITGGMWGGIIGGGLVLWVFTPQAPAPTTQVVHPPSPYLYPVEPPMPPPQPTPTPTPVLQIRREIAIEDAVEAALTSVVTVINYQPGYRAFQADASRRIVGSGVVVDTQGYIVTNAHVIADAAKIAVILADGREIKGSLIIENPELDLALLKVNVNSLIAATWGDSSKVRLGQPVLAIGSALGDFPNSVTMGIVSGLNRALALQSQVIHGLIQTDAAINQGNSGGPLINLQGEIIGINTFIIREDHNQGIAQGIGFAIPASSVKTMVRTWVSTTTNSSSRPVTIEAGVGSSPDTFSAE